MSSNIINTMPYLRNQRRFPQEIPDLVLEIDKSYVDTANAVNARTIGIYPTINDAITGNAWYIEGKKYQTLRKIFSITSTANVPHGINTSQILGFAAMHGTYTDDTNWYGFLTTTTTGITDQIGFYLSSTDIVFTTAGAPHTLTQGYIVLEWISLV